MKRFAPLLIVIISCSPARTERTVAVAPTSSALASAPPIAATAASAAPPLEKGDVPPAPIPRVPIVRHLGASGFQTCVARESGSVMCWGQGALFDVDGKMAPPRATVVAGLTDAVEIAVDAHWACARRKNGAVGCFGNHKTLERAKSRDVAGLSASRIFTAREGICAIAGDELACFGPDLAVKRSKLPVPGAEIVDAEGSRDFACLVTSKGAVHCFGSDTLGALGGPIDANGFSRVRDIDDAVTVTTGDYFGCAVLASGYRACWGRRTPFGYPDKERTTMISRARNDVARVAGGRTTCWLYRDGSAQCEGDGKYGQHGDGSATDYGREKVHGLNDVKELSIGLQHVCALRSNDRVACWGANDRAQLGEGTLVDRTLPAGVIGLGGSEPPPAPKPGSGPPLAPPLKKAANAPWREADKPGWGHRIDSPYRYYSKNRPHAVGVHAALFKSGRAVHDEHGVVALEWPKNEQFVALDGDDAVWVGTKDSFLRAPDVLAAKKGAYAKVLAIPFATDFAVSKGIAVAADATTLHISRDGGKTFEKVRPGNDLTIENVHVRADGLIAIDALDKKGDHAAWIAKDGKTFELSKFQPAHVRSSGSHLFGYGCPGAILSSDGVTWNAWNEDYGEPLGFDGWGSPLVPSSWPRAFASTRLNNLVSPPPPAPKPDKAVTGKPGECTKGGMGGLGMGGFGARGRRFGGACVGAACLRATLGPEPAATETEVAFYGDGVCERDDKGLCTKAPYKRPPHIAVGLGAPIDVPSGCDPTRMLTAGGIGVLFCASGDQTVLHTVNKEGVVRKEAAFPKFDVDELTIADDGTLVAHPMCRSNTVGATGACPAALVRAPRPLGATDAWRATATPSPLSHRVLGAGEVLTIAAGSDAQRFSLFVDAPGKAPKLLAKDLAVAGDLVDLVFETDRIVVVEQITSRKETKSYVAANGLVVIVDAPKKPEDPPTPKKKAKKP